ncbi:hypothetical protein MMC34_006099 [Xylographa carneopallida]|nr:hypothetical protein [Xylographa carneopallida]
MTNSEGKYPILAQIRQSPPLEFPGNVEDSWLKNKVIVITGGASGFGEGWVRRWAAAGANIIFGDVNVLKGTKLAERIRTETWNENVHFRYCDVTSWPSQVELFKEAVRLSAHGGIDAVVANAGIADSKLELENPKDLDAEDPLPPNLDCLNVDLIGVIYTTHLAIFYLQRNPGSAPASHTTDPSHMLRDRHLLLIGSAASFCPIPYQALYGASKHAVMGLYRCLRSTIFVHGIRINLVCPYFVDTPILTSSARSVLAGATIGAAEDVIEAGSRFMADPRIVGRAVSIGPKLRIEEDENGGYVLTEKKEVAPKAIWEIYATDFEDTDVYQRRLVWILNRALELRGWIGWGSDMVGAMSYRLKGLWRDS